jgi:CarD family transcriptional regulator
MTKLMYRTGELIIYGNTGVCEVMDVTTVNYPGIDKDRLYYALKPLYQSGVIYTPVNTSIFMRPVISSKKAQQLIDSMPAVNFYVMSQDISAFSEKYQEMLQTHDCADLIKLIAAIYCKQLSAREKKQRLGKADEKFMKQAEDQLYGEFAVALKMNKDDIPQYIDRRIAAINNANSEKEDRHNEYNQRTGMPRSVWNG